MIKQTASELHADNVGLDIEGIGRRCLNAYRLRFQTGGDVVGCFKEHRRAVVSTTLMAAESKALGVTIQKAAKRGDQRPEVRTSVYPPLSLHVPDRHYPWSIGLWARRLDVVSRIKC